jgi:membrane glycosyltransferase
MSMSQGHPTQLAGVRHAAVLTTPTGTQSMAELARRRQIVVALNAATYLLLMWAAAMVLGAAGWTGVDVLLFAGFSIGSPWTVLGFWNALIGLWLLHGAKDPMSRVAPFAGSADAEIPIAIRTAVLMTLRNEEPARAFRRLRAVKTSLDATGFGDKFGYFILSDSDLAAVAAAEEAAAAAWRRECDDPSNIIYRRRTHNDGYKAGNVRDFCERWGRTTT